MKLGETIKNHRKKAGWTLTQLSERCRISVAQLSKLENNKSNPSIDSLRKLAEAFEVPLSALTLTQETPAPVPVTEGEGHVIKLCSRDGAAVTVRCLAADRTFGMQPMILTIPEGMSTGERISRAGDEFFYVLKGAVRFIYGMEMKFVLDEGDFLYYDAVEAHTWENIGNGESRLFVCRAATV